MLKWVWEEQSNHMWSLLRRKKGPGPSLLANPPLQQMLYFPSRKLLCLQELAQRHERQGSCTCHTGTERLFAVSQKTAQLQPAPVSPNTSQCQEGDLTQLAVPKLEQRAPFELQSFLG